MQAHTVERVESWDSRPFSDGVRELHDLADGDFSGAAVADGTWLFMLNGRVVGVYEGDIDDFEDASGTVYDAPHPSLPLLFSMQERGGETQAKYYTNDTPLSEVDGTLSDGNFTGYVELSENVLSGDYYVVYYGGRSMSAAFVGASEELVAGDDAFELANDEVGVYEVCKTAVNVTSLPKMEDTDDDEPTAAGGTAGGVTAGEATDSDDNESRADATTETEATEDAESRASTSGRSPSERSSSEGTSSTDHDPEIDTAGEADSDSATGANTGADESAATSDTTSGVGAATSTENVGASAGSGRPASRSADSESGDGESTTSAASSDARAAKEGVFDDEEEWRNARSIPTLDPKESEDSDSGESDASGRSRSERRQSRPASSKRQQSAESGGKSRSTVEKLKRAVQQRNAKLEEAGERIDSLEGERTELRERVEALRDERDALQARVEELEAAAERNAGAGGADTASADIELEPEAALADTNLFVRYDSKGKPTLDELDSQTDADAVNENLRIDHHTQFEAANASVDGEPFESFLASSNAYRFVSWAVRKLPYEIRDAGHAPGLAELYEALPRVDRAELDGTVEAEVDEETVSRTFDVVLRDRMGEALVVAELNDERDAVTGDEMDALVDAATDVQEGVEDMSAAMYVTASFFEPQALETASDATGGGGFLSRSDKESYVKTGRKEGYHLCLVEDRNDAFHLTVPEL